METNPPHKDIQISIDAFNASLKQRDARGAPSPGGGRPGVGARTVRALGRVAEAVHGARCRFTAPARFSIGHGGKDRRPFPVLTQVYDRAIQVMKSAVLKARLGNAEELAAIGRLDDQARRLERQAAGPCVAALIEEERADSHTHGGRSDFGGEPAAYDVGTGS